MAFNLLDEPWIPVRHRSGARRSIAPSAITDQLTTDPIVDVASPRPDFDGSLVQFLIALIQTAAAPADPRAWRAGFDVPPAPATLQAAMERVRGGFDLDGDGPRFAQDLERNPTWSQKDIAQLLMEQPGDQTLRRNTDVFIKRGGVASLCPACAAAALFTLQTNAPAGGQGHRTSLRGGGPLTTLLLGETLWHTVWLNVFDDARFCTLTGNPDRDRPADKFPWLAPTCTSTGNRAVEPTDAHPLQVYWAMPRRVVLEFASGAMPCDVCRVAAGRVRTYRTKNLGPKYDHWRHPLSPYYTTREGTELPVHARGHAVAYRDWLGWVASDNDKTVRSPAAVIQTYLQDAQRRQRGRVSLAAFGYETDNMKVVSWLEGTLPILIDMDHTEILEAHGRALIRGADHGAFQLQRALKAAWFTRPGDVKVALPDVSARFWQGTEVRFYELMRVAPSLAPDWARLPTHREAWASVLRRIAGDLFNELSDAGRWDLPDPRRVSHAWRGLQSALSLQARPFRTALDLPPLPEPPNAGRPRRERSSRR